MSTEIGTDLRLAIVDPAGSAASHPSAYPDFAGEPSDHEQHKPAELCAFAACTAGTYHGCGWQNRTGRAVPEQSTAVLVKVGAVERRHQLAYMRRCLGVVRRLRRRGKTVAVTFTEAGIMQVAEQLEQPVSLRHFFAFCREADGAVAATPEGVPVLRGLGARHVDFIPTPCPVDDPRWDLSAPAERRRGVLVGTYEFETNYRNHLASLLCLRDLAAATGEPVTVVVGDGGYHRRMVEWVRSRYPDGLLRVVEALPALAFVRLAAAHKLVFQLDQAGAVGQIGSAALLARVPCVGGHGAVERLVFPDLCGTGRTADELVALAARLLADRDEADAAMARAMALAAERVSYAAIHARLAEFYRRIGGR